MRQVPHYLIIGNGRVSRHFQRYFSDLNLSFDVWHRAFSTEMLREKCINASHILLLISDRAIEPFIDTHLSDFNDRMLIHCSGSIVSERAFGAHPLMCFSETLYESSAYPAIPFVIDENAPDFESLLPGLPNPHARLHPALKSIYHAVCVLSANFSCLLWQKLFSTMQHSLQIPAHFAYPILQRQTHNLLTDAGHALTGPLTRQDTPTLMRHIEVLAGDPFQKVYKSFVECYAELEKSK